MAFHGKVALVTGAGSGMGRLTVQMLAKGGAQVAALDVNEAGLKETAEGMAAKRFANPEDIVEAIEKGIEKGTKILLPDFEFKLLTRWQRFAPRLLWKVILKSEGL
jgi:NADP-dependent 3-hydroxy acid dehydrogenase YdfG